MVDYKAIGERLRSLREARGMTQKEVAAAIGLTVGGVSAIEHAKGKPPLFRIEAYCNAVGADIIFEIVDAPVRSLGATLATMTPEKREAAIRILEAMPQLDAYQEGRLRGYLDSVTARDGMSGEGPSHPVLVVAEADAVASKR